MLLSSNMFNDRSFEFNVGFITKRPSSSVFCPQIISLYDMNNLSSLNVVPVTMVTNEHHYMYAT